MLDSLKNLWYRDPKEPVIYINDVVVRIRAGILLIIPLYMAYTLYDVTFTSKWIVDESTAIDTYETNQDVHVIYIVEATKRTYEYSIQTLVLLYALYEMVAGMFLFTSRFSPVIHLGCHLARNTKPVWKPLKPKRFAWSIGASFIIFCLIFFNPDSFAEWVNSIIRFELIPTEYNYLPKWIPNYLVWICIGFMWLEAILGYCVGCKIYALLARIGLFREDCEECSNIKDTSNK